MMRNLAWVTLHHGVGRAAVFVFFLALPRLLGIEATGRFTFWYTVILMVCQPMLDFSLNMVVVKYTARGDLGVVRRAFIFAGGFLPLLLLGLYFVAVVGPWPENLVGLLLLSFGLSLSLNLVFSYFRGLEDLQVEGVVGGASKLLGPILLFALAARVGGTPNVGPWIPAVALVGVGIGGWLLVTTLYPGRLRAMVASLKVAEPAARSGFSLVREGLALGAVGLVGVLYLRIDVVMLGAMVGESEVGFYFTASKIVETAFIVPHILMLVIFPRLVKAREMTPLLRRFSWLFAGLSLAATAAVVALGFWGVPLVYGGSLSRISTMVFALSPTVVAVYLGYLFTQALIVKDLQARYLAIAAAGLALNLVLNVLLIPHYQGIGAAAATVATEILITVAAVVTTLRATSTAGSGS
jgi:O-antigen/teichoic acid export membrane protein